MRCRRAEAIFTPLGPMCILSCRSTDEHRLTSRQASKQASQRNGQRNGKATAAATAQPVSGSHQHGDGACMGPGGGVRRCSVSMPTGRLARTNAKPCHALTTNFSLPLALVSRSLPSLHPRALGPGRPVLPWWAWHGMALAWHGIRHCLVWPGRAEQLSSTAISPHPGPMDPIPQENPTHIIASRRREWLECAISRAAIRSV